MKKHGIIFVFVALVIIAACWMWRYVTMNAYYDGLNNSDHKLYMAGEKVPFEDDGLDLHTDLSGYFIRTDGFEIMDYQDYLDLEGLTVDGNAEPPDRLALVYITLGNETCEPNPVTLIHIQLHTVDTNLAMDWSVLTAANPILEGNVSIALPQSSECQLVLPFALNKESFQRTTWRNMDDCAFYLTVTTGLTTKEILVNE